MSNAQFVSSRAAIASAALLSLALLAGCQSKPDAPEGGASVEGGSEVIKLTPGDNPIVYDEDLIDFLPVGDRVQFALDRHDLTPEAEATLQRQAALLQRYPHVVVTIEGHADERGTREYNLALGERRADAVRNYLIAVGIPSQRISVISYGKERPECPEASEGCWSQNRRGVTVASQ
jgi:peptidoglycan-associated lipoprotein